MLDPRSPFAGAPCVPEAELSLPAAFDRVVSAHGCRLALVSDGWRLTYDQLNIVANGMANSLLARGSACGDRVAILMDHDIPAIVALVAGLKAGCAVVPMNATHPPVRLRQVLERTSPTFIIVDSAHRHLASQIVGLNCIPIVFEQNEFVGTCDTPTVEIAPDDIAVLISTSGSTGSAKIVMATHRHLLRNGLVLGEAMAITAADRIPLFGAMDGTQGLGLILCALLSGSSLHPFAVTVKGVLGLASWMSERQINTYISSASVFRSFMKTLDPNFKFERVRAVRLASEAATEEDVRLFRQHFTERCMLVHALASSETGNIAWAQYLYTDAIPAGRLSVGLPSRGHRVLIIGDGGQAVTPGEVGEIVVCSHYIARGYWNDPEMTTASFSGVLESGGFRQYRTGDLGRINDSGQLEFCGRKDSRVKIRGNRIELDHVQSVVRKLAGIEDAIVEAVERPDHEPMLVAFVTLAGHASWSHAEFRQALRKELPDYMVPSRFVVVDRFPLTPTGKIDRQRLKESEASRPETQQITAPATAPEAMLAEIWCKVFELQEIDRDADFFELGGIR
jgi:amino acid adenylation domain-containing protein